MPLSDALIRAAKPKEKPYRLADEKALYLEVSPSGGKLWRLKYRFGGKERRLALGVYPDVTLTKARKKRDAARELLADGMDPGEHKKRLEARYEADRTNSFEAVAREWLAMKRASFAPATYDKAEWLLGELAFPWIGSRPVSAVTPPEVLAVLRRVEERGKLETAHRLKQRCSQVFRYAVATGRAERDPCVDLRGAMASPKIKHRASITDPGELGALLRAIHAYKGGFVTACALKLAPLLFVRPGELRHAEWSEFDLEAGEWRIPAAKMKMREAHIVPLSEQAVAVLSELRPLTGRGLYVFPSVRDSKRPMSENTVLAALRRMGYTTAQMSGHGFRSTASTRLHEMGWPSHVIERQLAHAERNKVKAAYNFAEYMPDRRKMMQSWADYLDKLRERGNVTALRLRA